MAGPARTATPLPPRIGRAQSRSYSQMLSSVSDGEDVRFRGLVAKAFDGKLNNTGTLTLATGGASTTDIDDPRIGTTTIALLVGIDQNGAASLPTISQAVTQPGRIRLTHTVSGLTRTIGYALFGILFASGAFAQSVTLFGLPQSSNPACAAGEYWLSVNSSTAVWKKCENGSITDMDAAGAAGAPTTADYLVGTANGSLSAEIVVGTTPGGELGGTWAAPTIDSGVVSLDEVGDFGCTGLQLVRRNTGDTAFECSTAPADDDVPEAGDFGALSATLPITQSGGTISTSMATARLIGRTTAGTGVMESLTVTSPLSLAAGALGLSQHAGTDVTADLEEEAHATEHQHGGADEIASATAASNAIVKAGGTGTIDANWVPTSFATDAEVIASFQPLNAANLSAIAALTTTAFGRGVLDDADAAALRTTADAQQLDTDLTAVAALVTTTGGRSVLATTPADDQVYVGDSASAGTWRAVPDCGEAGTLNYTAATNSFSCLTDSGGGGGSAEVSVVVTAAQPSPAPVVVTGQAWVASGSEIVCSPFGTTADGLTPEAIMVSEIKFVASDRVVGTGFTVHTYSPNGLEGTVRAHCAGI